jgi:nitrogen regulatory protein PII
LRSNVRIEVYVGEDRRDEVLEAVKRFAVELRTTAGILVIESVDRLIDLNTGNDVLAANL